MDEERVSYSVEKKLSDSFLFYVENEHDSVDDDWVKMEVDYAIRSWIYRYQRAHTHTRTQSKSRGMLTRDKILDDLTKRGLEINVPKRALELSIHEVAGTDPRTVLRYTNMLLERNMLKQISPFMFKRLDIHGEGSA